MNENWKPIELKFKEGGWLSEDYPSNVPNELLCPQCGFNYLHIVKVIVQRRSDDVVITKDKVSVENGGSPTRGTVVQIEYTGECGHNGLIIFNFHKGNVHLWHKPLPKPKKHLEDIFRD